MSPKLKNAAEYVNFFDALLLEYKIQLYSI